MPNPLEKLAFQLTLCGAREGDPLLVACSGGPDSLFLAEALVRLGWRPALAHIDHGLRGTVSTEEAEFTREYARKRNLPFFLRRLELARAAAPRGQEAQAREARYAALFSLCRDQGVPLLATAHHADDQVETILLRMLQGSSPYYWTGMAPRREGPGATLIRPLLTHGRQEIRTWLAREEQDFRLDPSNEETRFLRNRLRKYLSQMPGRDREALHSLALETGRKATGLRHLQERLAEQFLEERARHWKNSSVLSLEGLPALPSLFLFPIIEALLRRLGGRAPRGTVAAAADLWRPDCPGGKQALDPGGVRVVRSGQTLEFHRQAGESNQATAWPGMPPI